METWEALSLSLFTNIFEAIQLKMFIYKKTGVSPLAGCKKLSDDNNVLYSKETIRRVKSSDQTDVAKVHSNEWTVCFRRTFEFTFILLNKKIYLY